MSMAEGLIHSTQLICQLLSTIEPLSVSEAIHYIRQTTILLLNVLQDDKQQDIVSSLTPADSEVCVYNLCILCVVCVCVVCVCVCVCVCARAWCGVV